MSAAIAGRVAKGAALLDAKRPGWDAHIDLAALDLEKCSLCVIGQLFGPEYEHADGWKLFDIGLRALGITGCGEIDYGFDRYTTQEDYAALTAEWRRVITARRLAAERVSAP